MIRITKALLSPFTWHMAWRDSRASRRKLLLFSCSIVLGIAALTAIGEANEALLRNPNESLLLQSLLVRLSGLAG